MAFHPNYSVNGYFFVHYTNISNHASTLVRYEVSANPDIANADSDLILLSVSQPFSNHNGGDLHFGPDGYLYISMGDGGSGGDPGNRAQNKTNLLGKLLRIDVNKSNGYGIPTDNPFVGDESYTPELWALGLRNPWKFSFDRITGDKWIADVGQHDWEEINFEAANEKGKNYGWRCYEGNNTYNTSDCLTMSNYDFPVFEYPNSESTGCSVTGGYRYRGTTYKNWWGSYIHADYCSGKFWETRDSLGHWITKELVNLSDFQYVSFGQGRYGELYIAEHSSGDISKLTDTTCIPKAHIIESDSTSFCGGPPILHALKGPGFTYQWFLENIPVNGSASDTLNISQNGRYSLVVTNQLGEKDTSAYAVIDFCDFSQCVDQPIKFTPWLLDNIPQKDFRTQVGIKASAQLLNMDTFRLFAKDHILFDPNFEVQLGGILQANIENCP
jgi:hypothetical protein